MASPSATFRARNTRATPASWHRASTAGPSRSRRRPSQRTPTAQTPADVSAATTSRKRGAMTAGEALEVAGEAVVETRRRLDDHPLHHAQARLRGPAPLQHRGAVGRDDVEAGPLEEGH